MKKVAVYTLNGLYNYGNRLQNYALVKYINNNFDCECYNIWEDSFLQRIKNKIKILLPIKKYKRMKNFILFNNMICRANSSNKFDYYIVGSDQVWNPFMNSDKDYLLSNIKSNNKVSYSASFGISELPVGYKSLLKSELSKFKLISVRENKGKELIDELQIKKNIDVLIDPTMLLTSEEWDSVLKKPKQIMTNEPPKYILNYFLGETSKSIKNEIERVAKDNNCEIINLLDKNDPFYECGPSEFLYLEKNAFLICTDSFHSSVFAILYKKPFVVFERHQVGMKSMQSRLETLLKTFELDYRMYNGEKITRENLNNDYSQTNKILESERKKSKSFLMNAFDLK